MKGTQQAIYWEKQQDKMCGVHCVNTLLQGPFYNQVTLAQIGLELDQKEKELMSSNGVTNEYLKYMGEESGNVAQDGNYSLQVLSEALKRMSEDLTITSIDAIKDKSQLTNYSAFICNSSAHWFTIRRVGDVIYNLNSTNRQMPQIVTQFFLSLFLMAVKEGGYQIFVIDGTLPLINPSDFEVLNKNQVWVPASKIKAYQQKRMKANKNFQLNISGSDEKDMQDAIKRSLGKSLSDYSQEEFDKQAKDTEEDQPQKKFEAYKGVGSKLNGGLIQANYSKFETVDPNEDPETFFLIRQSMQQSLKTQPKEGVLVVFRLSNGDKLSRRFGIKQPVQRLYDWVFLKLTQGDLSKKVRFYLCESSKKQNLLDVNTPLSALGEDDRVQLFVNET